MPVRIPEKLTLANLPTRIEKMERLSEELGIHLYVKRDDQTGSEWSGNKIRKLEFAVSQALGMGCNLLITCGGNQSNHCRATAAVAARLGISSLLVLRGSENTPIEGNLLMDKLLGAEIVYVTPDTYASHRNELMQQLAEEKKKAGFKPYIIPEGASNGIGSFGYYQAFEEILIQEEAMNIRFDAIAVAVGSGGTYSGLLLGKMVKQHPATLLGYLVGGSKKYFEEAISQIFKDFELYLQDEIHPPSTMICLKDDYIGRGYGLNTPDELKFIQQIAKTEGIIFDNVYTGKAFFGLISDIRKGKYPQHKNILFLHTGGLFELFSQTGVFEF